MAISARSRTSAIGRILSVLVALSLTGACATPRTEAASEAPAEAASVATPEATTSPVVVAAGIAGIALLSAAAILVILVAQDDALSFN